MKPGSSSVMSGERFWRIIDRARRRALASGPPADLLDRQIPALAEALRELTPQDVAAFERRFGYYMDRANRWEVRAVACWLQGGGSLDGFLDFRACLISLGKELFSRILKDPDSLAEIVDRPDVPYLLQEGIRTVSIKVYREKTGQLGIPRLPGEAPPAATKGRPVDSTDKDDMRRRYPNTVKRFPEPGEYL